jgi:peptidase A4-like protein
MSRLGRLAAIAGAAAVAVGLSAGPAAASPVTWRAPAGAGIAAPPIIAAGYFAVPKPGSGTSFIHVQDTFIVPQVACTGTRTTIAQQRAGLDGFSDATVERVGISEACAQGAPAYFAWYQMYPAMGHAEFSMAHAGDRVHLSVTDDGGHFTLSVQDLSSGQNFTVIKTCATCQASSAQVTAGPKTGTPLADFGSVDFTGIQVTDNGGVTGGLKNPAWNTVKMTDPFSPRAVAGPLHTFAAPPHSEFVDHWMA